jgi:meso-butanediol dehydrogenase / (S,S)-butanediol dehydrogenase / diacetyl reductase
LAIIVITGAGAGLGRALARRFAAEGETVILLGRTLAKVEKRGGRDRCAGDRH